MLEITTQKSIFFTCFMFSSFIEIFKIIQLNEQIWNLIHFNLNSSFKVLRQVSLQSVFVSLADNIIETN